MKRKLAIAVFMIMLFSTMMLGINQVKAAGNVVVSMDSARDSIFLKSFIINGEIKNTGDTPVTNISVTINEYDAANNFLNSTKGLYFPMNFLSNTNPLVLMPGAKASFSGLAPESVDHVIATVSFIECSNLPLGLEISVSETEYSSGGGNILGTVKNTGTASADDVELYAFFYDASGKLLGSGGDTAIGALDAGQSKDFNAILSGLGIKDNNVASYGVYAESFTGDGIQTPYVAQYISTSQTGAPSTGTTPTATALTGTFPTATVPELSSISLLLIILIASTATLFIYKKRQ